MRALIFEPHLQTAWDESEFPDLDADFGREAGEGVKGVEDRRFGPDEGRTRSWLLMLKMTDEMSVGTSKGTSKGILALPLGS
jgi:hypothetical protein